MAVPSKLVCITNIAAPYQVKFCYALAEHFDTHFWFYEQLNRQAASFWRVPLGERCAIIPGVRGATSGRYMTRAHLAWLNELNPDVLLLGGLSIPANFLAYRWAQRAGKKTILLTELSRAPDGKPRRRGAAWSLLSRLYNGLDSVFALTPDAATQFRDEFGFGEKVVQARYATDLEAYFAHPLRNASDRFTLMFANRLAAAYNPEEAIHIFAEVAKEIPASRLHMNALGELRPLCEALVEELGLTNRVVFLDQIQSWDALHEEYRRCDVLLFPARHATGNFTIYEAMASGMGLIISDRVLGNGGAVRNGENGFRLPLDRAQFVSAILRYHREPGLLQKHGAYTKEWVRPFGMVETAALYRDLIGRVL